MYLRRKQVHNIKIFEICYSWILCILYCTSHRIQCGCAMVCYKKYLKHLVNLAQFWYSLVKMQTCGDLRFKIKGIGTLRIVHSPPPSGTEKRLRLRLKDKTNPFLHLGPQSLFLFRSVFSYSVFVANINNEYWSPGAFQALVQRSEHKWSGTMSWKHSCRLFYIYVHTYIDQNRRKHTELSRAHRCLICYCIFLPLYFQ